MRAHVFAPLPPSLPTSRRLRPPSQPAAPSAAATSSLTRSRRLHPRPSSLLTLPVDSRCPALSATLTRSVSVTRARYRAAHVRTMYMRVCVCVCVYICTPMHIHTARHSAFPLHLRFGDCGGASERTNGLERKQDGTRDRHERAED